MIAVFVLKTCSSISLFIFLKFDFLFCRSSFSFEKTHAKKKFFGIFSENYIFAKITSNSTGTSSGSSFFWILLAEYETSDSVYFEAK